MTLLEETRDRLARLPKGTTLVEVGEGCGVSVAWLSRLNRGLMPNPGVIQVEKLCEYLRSLDA
jgi:transcriptional regulator with XRE-family HTH domain